MISFDEAFDLVRRAGRPLGSERVTLDEAADRVLAEPVHATIDAPRGDVSAMDGYAVREADLENFPVRLKVVGESFPGTAGLEDLPPESCLRIFTGAALPPKADCVVIQENVWLENDTAVIETHPGPAGHVRARASDFAKGDRLLERGRLLDARALVAAAGADLAEVNVALQPRVAILGTGDELAPPGMAKNTEGTIPESVTFGVAALAEQWGSSVISRTRLCDELDSMKEAAASALCDADLVLVTGGASVGKRDFAKAMFEDEGLELIFSKVAIKPGKPVWFGRAGKALVMGLPGNPTSALVTGRLFLAPLLAGLTGRDPAVALACRRALLTGRLGPCGERETFVRARWAENAVQPLDSKDSSAQRALAAAELLIRRSPGARAAEAGDPVDVLDF
ncbi:MAG: molybdopterin molybdotransferase MoeA [Parasphingopyxis sp.]|nr:molybdopterin molybdotransferase MoeA [Sphingomonadales bacterium]